jgi:hypothetical protein
MIGVLGIYSSLLFTLVELAAAKQDVVTANRHRETGSETDDPQQAPSWVAVS